MMQVPVGPFAYSVRLIPGYIICEGAPCNGITDTDRQTILISQALEPSKRLNVCWHEIAHAWHAELKVCEACPIQEESVCNLVGMGMTTMHPRDFVRVYRYMTTGRISPD